MRPPTSPAGVMGPFYRLARPGGDPPLSYQIAQAVTRRAAGQALIITGLVDETRFPRGEIDGPIGSAALARALGLLGWEVTIIVDAEAHGPISAVLGLADLPTVKLIAGDLPDADAARRFGASFDVVFAVEKLGRNSAGVRHLIWGTPCPTGDPFSDDYVLGASEAGVLTIGVGDNGNEIGFGKLPAAAASITPNGVDCGCPCGRGIMSATPCDYLLPASISNLGCYVLSAALAVITRRPDLAVQGEQVLAWTTAGLDAGLRSGGVDDPDFRGDDGVPLTYVAAHAQLIAGVVHQALLGEAWVARNRS
jgi:hypothetical protein